MNLRPDCEAARRVCSLASRQARQRWKRLDPEIRQVLALAAAPIRLAPERLLERGRGPAREAHARQLAMYLCHVGLGRTFTVVGSAFGRDRSTVSHACARIEDLRDDARFDALVTAMEEHLPQRDDESGPDWGAHHAAG